MIHTAAPGALLTAVAAAISSLLAVVLLKRPIDFACRHLDWPDQSKRLKCTQHTSRMPAHMLCSCCVAVQNSERNPGVLLSKLVSFPTSYTFQVGTARLHPTAMQLAWQHSGPTFSNVLKCSNSQQAHAQAVCSCRS